MRWALFLGVAFSLASLPYQAFGGDWPQFRGPAAGNAVGAGPLPTEIAPDKNVLWKVQTPPGHSSPVIAGDRIYLTGVEDEQLVTLALDRETGKRLWTAVAPHETLEEIHNIGSHAQPSPATDGERVVAFFGSSGLFCYDRQGKLLWSQRMGPFKNNFGAGSSPLIAGDLVILNQDHDTDSFLAAFDKKTGKQVWKTDRSEFPRGYASPILWKQDGRTEVVVAGTLKVKGYDLATGEEVWNVSGISRIVNMTPLVGPNNILYVPAWSPGGDDGDRIEAPPFDQVIAEHDKNGNGMLEPEEVPDGPLKQRFNQIDRDKDNHITRAEHESMRNVFDQARNVLIAIKPGGRGDITTSHVLWTTGAAIPLPYVPSPVYHAGHLYMVRNGGIVSSVDATTGEPVKKGRISGRGDYYSSPVVGDGKIYICSQRGTVCVVSAEKEWEELASADFGEDIIPTPAILDGRIYLRTKSHLYCFSSKPTDRAQR